MHLVPGTGIAGHSWCSILVVAVDLDRKERRISYELEHGPRRRYYTFSGF